jgi:hypothetical protein
LLLPAALVTAGCPSHNVRGDMLDVSRDTTALLGHPNTLRTGPVTVGEFQYRASNNGLKSRWPPVIVAATVTVTNVSDHAAAIDLLGGNCAVRLRVYTHQVPLSKPVFDAAAEWLSCYVPILHYALTPGQSITLVSPEGGPGLDLAPGRYDLGAVVTVVPTADSLRRRGPQRIELGAGGIQVPLPYD